MKNRLLRREEVENLTSLSRSIIYRMMNTCQFPQPVRVGSRAVRWRLSEIIEWMDSRPSLSPESWSPKPV